MQPDSFNMQLQSHFLAARAPPISLRSVTLVTISKVIDQCLGLMAGSINTIKDSPQSGKQSLGNEVNNSPESQSSPKDKEGSISSRIPRVTGLKQTANTSAAKEHRGGSSIPVAIQRRSIEPLGVSLQKRQSELSSGLRLVEKPRGPRPRPHTEQTAFTIPESAQGTEPASQTIPPSTSSSSISTWDFRDVEEAERPPTVFTGEYRTRNLGIPGHHSPRPILRIASSAENLIMGGATLESSSNTIAHKANPSLRERLNKITPSTPKETDSLKGTTPGSRGTLGSKSSAGSSQDGIPTSRSLPRSQVSLDSISKRDISGKEMAISRKPVSNKPSVHGLFSPSSKGLRSIEEPVVPKIPDQYSSSQAHSVRRVSVDSPGPATACSEKDVPSTSEPEATPMPRTAIKIGTMNLHPPRTSSLQALSELSEQSPAASVGLPLNVTAGLKRNVTFNYISPLASKDGQSSQSPDKSKFAESRSNHLLESFRNIFRSRSGATDKDRTKIDENCTPRPSNENQAHDGSKAMPKKHQTSVDCAPKNLDVFYSCLETLCKKVGEAPTSLERDRHIRLALRLQQQLGDYQSIEKTALEAELLAKKKLLERKAAEESLNTSLAEAQAQLDEN
ncbi:uncharacterized protein BDV17DRAFT_249318 [Aspergillus undulatus]|uniref:uncharacterized protein n=1 Tax=Aspergillus undulatus TaxID=1810928 RepID=UPI003CCDBC1B